MEDKRKLTAVIMGAITAYIQMEQKPPQVVPRVKLRTNAERREIMPIRKKQSDEDEKEPVKNH